jgi:hypothetical protein
MHNLRKLLFVLCSIITVSVYAQSDSVPPIEVSAENAKVFTEKTFNSTHVINLQTNEVTSKRTLDVHIQHRFGEFNDGSKEFWGLDGGATIRLGVDYSFDGRLMFGIGRSSYQKMADGFIKYKWLRQKENNSMPISLTLFGGMYYTLLKDANKDVNGFDKYENSYSRMSYVFQTIVSRKFNDHFSMLITPFFVHYNQVDKITDLNDMYGASAALRYKFSKRMSVTAEYSFRINDYSRDDYYNNFGIGFEIETGGHVFQFHFTNATGIAENQFLPYTKASWADGGVRLGFNIQRSFWL